MSMSLTYEEMREIRARRLAAAFGDPAHLRFQDLKLRARAIRKQQFPKFATREELLRRLRQHDSQMPRR